MNVDQKYESLKSDILKMTVLVMPKIQSTPAIYKIYLKDIVLMAVLRVNTCQLSELTNLKIA